jgi:transposase
MMGGVMAKMGRRLVPLVLTKAERETLERYVRRRKSAQQLALRSRIVLRCADGLANREVAKQLRVHEATVCKWRGRFVAKRLDGLSDDPRPGAPRKVSDETVERIVTMTLESTPGDATHWSTRDLAKRVGVSQSTVSRVWRAFNLQPHRVETFRLSNDPLFIEKVRDIVGLYMNPPAHAAEATRAELPLGAARAHRSGRLRTALFRSHAERADRLRAPDAVPAQRPRLTEFEQPRETSPPRQRSFFVRTGGR